MTQPAMDTAAFAEMKALMGDTFRDVLSLTLENLPVQLQLLEQAINDKAPEQIFSIAHRIKSGSGTIGALGLAQKAEAIELIGREGSADISEQLLEALKDSISNVVELIQQELNAG